MITKLVKYPISEGKMVDILLKGTKINSDFCKMAIMQFSEWFWCSDLIGSEADAHCMLDSIY